MFHALCWWLRLTPVIPAPNKLSLKNNNGLSVSSSLLLGAQRGENSTSFWKARGTQGCVWLV